MRIYNTNKKFFLKVDFTHQRYTHRAVEASTESRRLWAQLLQLLKVDEFRGLFGGDMISMNIYPIRVEEEWKMTYIQGRIIPNLAIEARTARPDPTASLYGSTYVKFQRCMIENIANLLGLILQQNSFKGQYPSHHQALYNTEKNRRPINSHEKYI
jgi:hypothetical protein